MLLTRELWHLELEEAGALTHALLKAPAFRDWH
jgi:hypothetical protein